MRRLTLMLALVLAVSAPAFAQTVTVTAERTNLRDKPATDGAVVVAVTKGDELEVLERAGAWYRVRVRSSGREGYVSSLLVSAVSGGVAPAAPSAAPPPPAPAPAPAPEPASMPPPDTSGGSMAQMSSGGSSGGSGFGIAIKGGLQFAKIPIDGLGDALDDEVEQARKTGVIGGLAFRIPLGETFAIQPEALLSMKGSKSVADEDDAISITYLELPVLATLRFGSGGVAPFIGVGPALALKLNASVERDDEDDIEEFIKSSDVGLVVAAGIDIGRLGIEARYTHGLTNIYDDAGLGVDTPITLKNRSFAILAGFTF